MIIDPDFPDHWKTRLLIDLLDGDQSAPLAVIRLWAHCQNRRTSTFPALPPAALKALCHYPGHANKLESALVTSGFVRREGDALIVHEWEDYNASLIANWRNGKKGGRPAKTQTQNKPMENPRVLDGKPKQNPSETDKIGLDEIRSDEIDSSLTGGAQAPKVPECLRTPEFEQAWEDYIAYRRAARHKALKPASVQAKWREMAQWGHDAALSAIAETISNGWQGIFKPKPNTSNNTNHAQHRYDKRSREFDGHRQPIVRDF